METRSHKNTQDRYREAKDNVEVDYNSAIVPIEPYGAPSPARTPDFSCSNCQQKPHLESARKRALEEDLSNHSETENHFQFTSPMGEYRVKKPADIMEKTKSSLKSPGNPNCINHSVNPSYWPNHNQYCQKESINCGSVHCREHDLRALSTPRSSKRSSLVNTVCKLVEENRLEEMVKEVQSHVLQSHGISPFSMLSDTVRRDIQDLQREKMELTESVRKAREMMYLAAGSTDIPSLNLNLKYLREEINSPKVTLVKDANNLGKSAKLALEEIKSLKRESEEMRVLVNSLVSSFGEIARETEMLVLEKIMNLKKRDEHYSAIIRENQILYNKIQDLKGNIRIYCRVRPQLKGEVGKNPIVSVESSGRVTIPYPQKAHGLSKTYHFSQVFGMASSQDEVFADTRPLIRSVLDGFNVCIFAYGQTGSGKTYTMMGPTIPEASQWGVNYRALHDLFLLSHERSHITEYTIGVQMVEIYNEQIRDLLDSQNSTKKLEIRKLENGSVRIPDAKSIKVHSTEDVAILMKQGAKTRSVGTTNMNERSSRSHSIVTVQVEGKETLSGSGIHGSLHLIDLAGSERVGKSGATGSRLEEAKNINKSLLALGNVMSALQEKKGHVGYRDSKLTQLLEDSLGGSAKTLMFVHVSPDAESHYETFSTLEFAERVGKVELGAAKANKENSELNRLAKENEELKEALKRKESERVLKSPGAQRTKRESPLAGKTVPGSQRRRSSLIAPPEKLNQNLRPRGEVKKENKNEVVEKKKVEGRENKGGKKYQIRGDILECPDEVSSPKSEASFEMWGETRKKKPLKDSNSNSSSQELMASSPRKEMGKTSVTFSPTGAEGVPDKSPPGVLELQKMVVEVEKKYFDYKTRNSLCLSPGESQRIRAFSVEEKTEGKFGGKEEEKKGEKDQVSMPHQQMRRSIAAIPQFTAGTEEELKNGSGRRVSKIPRPPKGPSRRNSIAVPTRSSARLAVKRNSTNGVTEQPSNTIGTKTSLASTINSGLSHK